MGWWVGRKSKREGIHTPDSLLYSRSYYSIVKQLYPNGEKRKQPQSTLSVVFK